MKSVSHLSKEMPLEATHRMGDLIAGVIFSVSLLITLCLETKLKPVQLIFESRWIKVRKKTS